MKNKILSFAYLLYFLFSIPLSLHAQSLPASNPDNFVKDFYTNFYPQYVAYLKKDKAPLSELEVLLKTKPYFSQNLYKAFIKDEKKRQSSKGTIEDFIDFDPFTQSQDDVGNPKIESVKDSWGKKYVEVTFSLFPKHKVIVELIPHQNTWLINNFIYPDINTNLMQIFQKLQNQKRKKS